MPDLVYPCLIESISAEMSAVQAPGAAPNFVFHLRDMDVSQPDEQPAPSALPPGSICEACWDQPATRLMPAPWGGEMGVCAWCAPGAGDDKVVGAVIAIAEQAWSFELLDPYQIMPSPSVFVEYSTDGEQWHEHPTDCLDGVRYIRSVYVPGMAS